ncbi:uncharacterized protein LOC135480984 [Liolophura sinensis]|uniref:uncharacterized protein LOC135480984 n=1 Tax=Liolophura sinensis TaxID=3198878 RepID=UPI003158634F
MSDDTVDASQEDEHVQTLHDVNLEREGVRKLLDFDETLVREVALRKWSHIAVGDSNVSPRAKNNATAVPPTKTMKQRSVTESAIHSDSFVTGWFPEKTRPLRKIRKEHSSRTRDGVSKDSVQRDRFVWRDSKSKDLSDKYVFKHYRDTRKYMEQYRREHSCGATIHITKRVLSPKASDSLKCFPRNVQVYQVYSPSNIRKSELAVESVEQQGHQSNRGVKTGSVTDTPVCNDTGLSHHDSQKNGPTKEGKSAKSHRSASQQSEISDPSVVFKYKLAPRYVQNMLEHHQHLQKQKLRSNTQRQHGSKHSNGHIQNGNVSPDWDDGTEIRGRQCSAKQSLSSHSGVKANLATTQVTISPLPSVPIIVSQPSNQTPISTLAEKVVVNQNQKGNIPILPRGNQKTLDNLSSLSTGDNQLVLTGDVDELPWKQKVGILKVISEQGKNVQHAHLPRLPTRASSLTLPDIREGVSLDSDGGQSTGQRSSPGRRRTSMVSVCDSVNSQSGRSSVVSGIFSKTSLFTSIFLGKK